jgi:molecular chaperone GrpE
MDKPTRTSSSTDPLREPSNDSLEAVRKEAEELLAGWQRAKADLANFKREESERLERFAKVAAANLMRDLLPVLDSFALGITAIGKDPAAVKGFEAIRAQFESTLARHGLSRIKVERGDLFDPGKHEAMGEVPRSPTGGGPPGSIAEEIASGYLLHEAVLRPAKVLLVEESGGAGERVEDL